MYQMSKVPKSNVLDPKALKVLTGDVGQPASTEPAKASRSPEDGSPNSNVGQPASTEPAKASRSPEDGSPNDTDGESQEISGSIQTSKVPKSSIQDSKASMIRTGNAGQHASGPEDSSPNFTICPKHQTVEAQMVLEKCVVCLGPFAPLRWQGLFVTDCSTVWHKSCFYKTEDVQSEVSAESNDEMKTSDEDYVPDSDIEDSETGDLSSELGKADNQKSDNGQENPLQKQWTTQRESGQLTTEVNTHVGHSLSKNKNNFCFVCHKPQQKIARHLKKHEKSNKEIAHALSFLPGSKIRKHLLEQLRNRGNFLHNNNVFKEGIGDLKVKRRSKIGKLGKYEHCPHCKGMFVRSELWRHMRRCVTKFDGLSGQEEFGKQRVLALSDVAQLPKDTPEGLIEMLKTMRSDETSEAAKNDQCILDYAKFLFKRLGYDKTQHPHIRQKIRELGRLLVTLTESTTLTTLKEAIKPVNFEEVVRAIKITSKFNESDNSYGIPSLAVKLGCSLKEVAELLECQAIMANDDELLRNSKGFVKLYTKTWSASVSHTAHSTISNAKYNKPTALPKTDDVQRLTEHLMKTVKSSMASLNSAENVETYKILAKATLPWLILFNRRRVGEVSKIPLKQFLERDTSGVAQDILKGLSPFEQKLCTHFSRLELKGKRNRKVSLLLTPDMLKAVTLLIEKRKACGVPDENMYLFGIPGCLTYYRGSDCLRDHANKCGAQQPRYLQSTKLRKQVATTSQIINLKSNELDQLADFMGHNINVHREFYRLPEHTTQVAKISKLLMAMESGRMSELRGKTLDDLEVCSADDSDDSEDGCSLGSSGCTVNSGPQKAVAAVSTDALGRDGINPFGCGVELEGKRVADAREDDIKTKRQMRAKQTYVRKPWSNAETKAVMKHFEGHIRKGHFASKMECKLCKTTEYPVLKDRTVGNIKDFVRNRGVSYKRKTDHL
ncbi:hypothetical protein UPYG_G00027530 [Umbra pygmaea]|uniref:Uncharacterized protein n=1 Tax=Umbra pygmaea TaxID=75934 RepID=A0ABD0Y0L4_UMBPY